MDHEPGRQIVPPAQEGGRICRTILVIYGQALCESRTGEVLETLAPPDGTLIEANSNCLRSRREIVRMAMRLSGQRGLRHRTLLLRRLDRMPVGRMRQLVDWMRNRRLGADWSVVTCVAPRGAPGLERNARRIERFLAPEVVVDLRAAPGRAA